MVRFVTKSCSVSCKVIIIGCLLVIIAIVFVYYPLEDPAYSGAATINNTLAEPKTISFAGMTDEEILAAIRKNFPYEVYREQLSEYKNRLNEEYVKADLVERVALEREVLFVQIKLQEAEKRYQDKLILCLEIIRFLDGNRDNLTDEIYNSATQALQNGNTEPVAILLAEFYEKYRITLGGDSLDRAAKAIFLLGKISNEQSRYQKAYHYYRQAVKHDPENTSYLLAAAESANNIALYRNATIYYEAALHNLRNEVDVSPKKIRQLLIKLAEVWESRSNAQKAKEYYRQAEKINVIPGKP